MPYDITLDFALSGISYPAVHQIQHAYPQRLSYSPDLDYVGGTYGSTHPNDGSPSYHGEIFSFFKYEEGARPASRKSTGATKCMLDMEENLVNEFYYNEGTVQVASGVVTLSGSSVAFPAWVGFTQEPVWFEVGGSRHMVKTRDSDTQVTLKQNKVSDMGAALAALNIAAGSSYRVLNSNFREYDPHYSSLGEVAKLHKEIIDAYGIVAYMAKSNGVQLGFYDLMCLWPRRHADIRGSGFKTWFRQQEAVAKLHGGLLLDMTNEVEGDFFPGVYTPNALSAGDSSAHDSFVRSVVQALEVWRALGMSVIPMINPKTIDVGGGADISLTLVNKLIDAIDDIQPGKWGVWSAAGSTPTSFINNLPAIGTYS